MDIEKKDQNMQSSSLVGETKVMPVVNPTSEEEPTPRRRRRVDTFAEKALEQETVVQEDEINPSEKEVPAFEPDVQGYSELPKEGSAEQVTFQARTLQRDPLRRQMQAGEAPRPANLDRAKTFPMPEPKPESDSITRPLYRKPVEAPGYSVSKPMGAARKNVGQQGAIGQDSQKQPRTRRPAFEQEEYTTEERSKKNKLPLIIAGVALVLVVLVLGYMLIPQDVPGLFGNMKRSVSTVFGGAPVEPTNAPKQEPTATEFYAAVRQVKAGEILSFNLITSKNTDGVRLVDMDGDEIPTQISQVDNTDSLIWIIRYTPLDVYEGPVYAQIASEDAWIDTDLSVNITVLEAQFAVIETPTAAPEPSPEEMIGEETLSEEMFEGEETEEGLNVAETVETPAPFATQVPVLTQAPVLMSSESPTPTVPMIADTPSPEEVATKLDDREAEPSADQEEKAQTENATEKPQEAFVVTAHASADPSLITSSAIYDGSKKMTSYLRDQEDIVNMAAGGEYTRLPYGVLTFRSNAFRQNAAEGTVGELSEMEVLWKADASSVKGSSSTYYGINYTGQPAIIKWSTEVRSISNMVDEAKNTKGLTEVIVAGDDGRIYFLNLKTGEQTRKPINVGYPMRGTPSIHPYGFPLMSVGQYARRMAKKTGDIGLRVYSLVNQKQLYLVDGLDKSFQRPDYDVGSFETSSLYDAASDTMISAGTNGLLYLTKLNTRFEYNATTGEGNIGVSPSSVVFKSKAKDTKDKQTAIESSIAMYGPYVYYADMKGVLRCVDTTTLEVKWAMATGDAVEAAISLDMAEDGTLWLYTANTLQNRSKGSAIVRRINAATGEEDWQVSMAVAKPKSKELIAGVRASAVIGQQNLGEYVYYAVSYMTKAGGVEIGLDGAAKGALVCMEKKTGKVVWAKDLGAYTYSSPVAVYTEEGKGWIIQAVSNGTMVLVDGVTGKTVNTLKLDGTINASPAVYKNTLVIGTTGKGKGAIYGIELK